MAKEWILNSAMNRFQFNFSRNVGKVSESIRACSPKTLEEWETYYYENIRPQEYLKELGQRLYVKISEVISAEIDEITEEDCIAYIHEVVIHRTYDGYTTEIKTVYGQLERELGSKISPAPDEWDRLFNVDFSLKSMVNTSAFRSNLLGMYPTYRKYIKNGANNIAPMSGLHMNLAARFSIFSP